MTDKEFNTYFKALSDSAILRKLENILTCVKTTEDYTYLITCNTDLRGVVEQHLYQELTGRKVVE
jgi:hypothetical protein